MIAVGIVEGKKTAESGSQAAYHDWRTVASICVFILACLAAHAFWWVLAAWVSGNGLYNRFLCKWAQGSFFAVNNGIFITGFGKFSIAMEYPIFTTGWTEFLTVVFFGILSILLI
jgi:hypothetical protein